MAICKLLLAATASLLLAYASAAASTVHEELSKYGLPPGLLPDSVISYSLGGNGEFEVHLSSKCYVKFIEIVFYDKKVKGKLSYGQISDLEGIKVFKFFGWLPITGIVAHPDVQKLDFQSAFLSEVLSFSLFATIPHCIAGKGSYRRIEGLVAEQSLATSEV
ncbi:uncharacterized protein LOC110023365 isoform X1 [Phalaenopsis equestris]|uniref:uncharacterized protein LOC110023365 isoform X1 n=1 Tax=Phalaenopsis equestris TaxID=78828 RepID=UPI0009E479F6|nr:uncharacterized protein LOC110023365 isoform X1 [Phalaenopsis equestris]